MLRITLALLLIMPAVAVAADLVGQPRVVDGDTLALAGKRVRLEGMDAPEGRQLCQHAGTAWRCGDAAAAALQRLVGGSVVECEDHGHDRYRRLVAVCTAEGMDLGAEMVREGWALDYPHYSHGRYAGQQAEAKAAKRGLWVGEFIPPWEWRRGVREKR